MLISGGTARCPRDRLRSPRDGHRGGGGGCLERGAVLRTEELQGTGGQNTDGVRQPHQAGAPQYSQVSPVLDRHSQRQTEGSYYNDIH